MRPRYFRSPLTFHRLKQSGSALWLIGDREIGEHHGGFFERVQRGEVANRRVALPHFAKTFVGVGFRQSALSPFKDLNDSAVACRGDDVGSLRGETQAAQIRNVFLGQGH